MSYQRPSSTVLSLFHRALALFLILGHLAAAGAEIDINAFYVSDGLKLDQENSRTHMIYDASALLSVDKKSRILVGWSYANISVNDSTEGTTTKYSTTDMGPKILFYLNKNRNWMISATYNLLVTATYQDDASSDEWRGRSYKAEIGYFAPLGDGDESSHIGVKLNYYQVAFSESLDETQTYETVSYTRGMIYPSLSYSFRF